MIPSAFVIPLIIKFEKVRTGIQYSAIKRTEAPEEVRMCSQNWSGSMTKQKFEESVNFYLCVGSSQSRVLLRFGGTFSAIQGGCLFAAWIEKFCCCLFCLYCRLVDTWNFFNNIIAKCKLSLYTHAHAVSFNHLHWLPQPDLLLLSSSAKKKKRKKRLLLEKICRASFLYGPHNPPTFI